MLHALLAGDLSAGQALLDWLAPQSDDPLRRQQLHGLSRLMRQLVAAALHRAKVTDTNIQHEHERRRYFLNAAHEWQSFTDRVVELFVYDLFRPDDAHRFVIDVLAPGKLDGYCEG